MTIAISNVLVGISSITFFVLFCCFANSASIGDKFREQKKRNVDKFREQKKRNIHRKVKCSIRDQGKRRKQKPGDKIPIT